MQHLRMIAEIMGFLYLDATVPDVGGPRRYRFVEAELRACEVEGEFLVCGKQVQEEDCVVVVGGVAG